MTLLHISRHCTSIQAIIITSRVSCYREINNLSDDTKYASIITDIREQLLIKLRFPNFFWGVYMQCSVNDKLLAIITLKGKFPQTTMWIGRVESNFRNPTVKFKANFDNPFNRTNYAKFCMLPSLDRTMPESVISQENNSPLTLYIEFHNLFFSPWILIVQS